MVLRHGSENIVYGNFFLNGKGGVRVREGQHQYIYNNYFWELDDRAIYLQNESSDPLDNIHIGFNTVLDCSEVILGGDGSYKPTNVTLSNNIFSDPDDDLFEDATGNETWVSNIAYGSLGITIPANGITNVDPQLIENSEGFFGLASSSPAINEAQPGYAFLPIFDGINDIDSDILFDLMGQDRPTSINERDLGCNEFPHNVVIQPIATEENTGPDYNTSVVMDVKGNQRPIKDLIHIYPNPTSGQIMITLESNTHSDIMIDILDFEGKKVRSVAQESNFSGKKTISQQLGGLSAGIYSVHAFSLSKQAPAGLVQNVKFVKL